MMGRQKEWEEREAVAKELWWGMSQSERERLSVMMGKPNVGEPEKVEKVKRAGYLRKGAGGETRWVPEEK